MIRSLKSTVERVRTGCKVANGEGGIHELAHLLMHIASDSQKAISSYDSQEVPHKIGL